MTETKSAALVEQGGTTKNEHSLAQDALFRPKKQAYCWHCGYFRAARLAKHLNTFCALSGLKIRPESPVCEFYTTEAVL